jgi:hypothetical protein
MVLKEMSGEKVNSIGIVRLVSSAYDNNLSIEAWIPVKLDHKVSILVIWLVSHLKLCQSWNYRPG